MNKNEQIITHVLQDMNEGVMVIGNDGKIILINPRAVEILQVEDASIIGKSFAALFFEDERNDSFTQAILDAVYDKTKVHSQITEYFSGEILKYLNVITSELILDGEILGVIVVISDISELIEAKERLKLMKEISKLNSDLEKRNQYIRKIFGRYLSDDVVKEILDKKDGFKVGGALKNITVLMSDLRGFTAMCEKNPPDVLMNMLNHYLNEMGRIIKENNGTVIEFVGDGILAIFGAPIDSNSHARDAIIAAIQMQQNMENINTWNEEHSYPKLKMGIGINTGEAVVGNMGSDYAMKYNVIGKCINMCGRIESYTTGEQIYISENTKEKIKEELIIDNVLNVHPKGIEAPINIYSITGIKEPVGINFSRNKEKLKMLDIPITVQINTLEDKQVNDVDICALLIGQSNEELLIQIKEATNIKLKMYDNLVVQDQTNKYCKVIDIKEDKYLLSITG